MGKLVNLVGRKYTRLIVLYFVGHDKYKQRLYECRCDCGKIVIAVSGGLTSGNTKSCGCYKRDVLIQHKTKHNYSGKNSKEYNAWGNIKSRCSNPNRADYKNYGGRGIKICDRWMNSFENFLADIGRAPSQKHSIERKDNDGNYEPNNAFWATKDQQSNNKRTNVVISYNGKTQTLTQWCRELNVDYDSMQARIKTYGWSIEEAFTIPVCRKGINRHVRSKKVAPLV